MAKQCRAVCAATKGINFAVGRGHAFRNNLPIALGMGKGKDFEIFLSHRDGVPDGIGKDPVVRHLICR